MKIPKNVSYKLFIISFCAYTSILILINGHCRLAPSYTFHKTVSYISYHILLLQIRLEPCITKMTTKLREPISASLRLQVTLRYLGSGASFSLLEDIFRIPKNTLSGIIPDVCKHIWQELNKECIVLPQSVEEWSHKSQQFLDKWQYPFALGTNIC